MSIQEIANEVETIAVLRVVTQVDKLYPPKRFRMQELVAVEILVILDDMASRQLLNDNQCKAIKTLLLIEQ